jgi:hypothetical protein
MKLRRNVLQPLLLSLDDEPQHLSAETALNEWYRSLIPLGDRHFATRPHAMLQAYTQDRRHSALARMFQVANRIQACVNTVVVLCHGDSGLGAQAFMQACCQPYWNHLSRADRGSKPRMFFITSDCDNDQLQGLLHLLGTTTRTSQPIDELDNWALLVLAPQTTQEEESFWQLGPLYQALQAHVGYDSEALANRFMAVAPAAGAVHDQLHAMGIADLFIASEESPALQCFGPMGLLPATLLGINVMELTAGAAWMSDQLLKMGSDPDPVTRYLRWRDGDILKQRHRVQCRTWNAGLESWGRWMESVHDFCDDRATKIADNPATPPSKEWHIVVDQARFDPIFLNDSETAPSQLRQTIDRDQKARRASETIIAETRLALLDELHIGQLMQFHLLTSARAVMSD